MDTNYPSIERLGELQQLFADFSRVIRICEFVDTGRRENDIDHSYSLAMTCWFLAPKIAPELSLEKIFRYALSHDIVELHAGDTFVFAHEDEKASKSDREDEALDILANDWPDFKDMINDARGYKAKIDEEARFVKAVDKILPLLVIELGEGAAFWNRHKITLEMERENKVTIHVSDKVSPYYEEVLNWLEKRGHMYNSDKDSVN
jgi:5'-deoxynucleotidase YfbR-like HD superfamily hydrolase